MIAADATKQNATPKKDRDVNAIDPNDAASELQPEKGPLP